MNDDVKMVITSTFAIIALGWVLVRSADVNKVTTGLATSYSTAVSALTPPAN